MNVLFLVSMIVELIFGLGYLFIPATLLTPFGVSLDTLSTMFIRLFGSALLAFPVLLWYARSSANAEFKRGTVKTMFTYYLVSMILLMMAELSGMMNAMGWIGVILHLVLVVWFGYFLVKKPVPTSQAATSSMS